MSIGEIFDQVAEQMRSDLARARSALEHPGLKGGSFEEVFRNFLKEYLPKTVDISSGVVIDSEGRSTRQLDVIISDAAKTPIFYRSADTRVIPTEGVYAVIEVKANLDRQELERAFENMKSVRALRKTAYVRQTGAVINTRTMYGQEWDGWPTNYFVFAFDSSSLDALTVKLEEKHAQEVLPLWKRIDCICVLNQGVIMNQVPGGKFDALPSPGSQLGYYETQRALLLFYALISKYVFQAEIPHFRFTDYLGQLRF